MRGRRKEVIGELMETCFKKSVEKARVFLAIDGESSIGQIADKLKIKPPNVSRHIKDLLDHDLIKVRTTDGGKVIYEKTSQVKRIRLEEFLVETFGAALSPTQTGPSSINQEGTENAQESGVQSQNPVSGA